MTSIFQIYEMYIKKNNIKFSNEKNNERIQTFLQVYNPMGTGYTQELHFLIMELFKDEAIQEGYKKKEKISMSMMGLNIFFQIWIK